MSTEIIKRFYDYVGGGHVDAAARLLSDDAKISFFGPPSVPLSGDYQGAEGLSRLFYIINETLEILAFVPREFVVQGGSVVVLGHEHSRVKATGKEFLVEWVQVWTVEDEKIVRLRDYFDTGTMADAFS